MRIKRERLEEILNKVTIKDELVTRPVVFNWWRPVQSLFEKWLYFYLSEENVVLIAYRKDWDSIRGYALWEILDRLGVEKRTDIELNDSMIVFQKITMVGNKYHSEIFDLSIK